MVDLGPSASIAAVNRVRSGGFAGLFRREEFEVVVDGDEEPTDEWGDDWDDDRPPVEARRPGGPGRAIQDGWEDDETFDPERDLRFKRLLEQRLAELPIIDSAEVSSSASPLPPPPPPPPDPFLDRPVDVVDLAAHDRDGVVRVVAEESLDIRELSVPVLDQPTVDRAAAFWLRLGRANRELDAFLPMPAPRTAIVGPLAHAASLIEAHQGLYRLAAEDVVVLTERRTPTIDGRWSVARSQEQLLAGSWVRSGAAVVIVLDVGDHAAPWVPDLVARMRRDCAIQLVRYVVPGVPGLDDLIEFWTGSEDPYAIDLPSPVPPQNVLALIDGGHPVASVAGADITGELVVAMRDRVQGG